MEGKISLRKSFFAEFVVAVAITSISREFFVDGRSVPGGDGETKKCELFYFYDWGTDRCESCSDVCHHAEVKDTEEQCQRDCPEYLISQQCTPDEYYDEQTGTCSPCSELCKFHDILDTTLQCHTLCPDYQPKKAENKEDTGLSKTLSPPKPEDPRVHNSGESQSQLIWIIPLVSVLAIFIAVMAVIIVIKRTHPQAVVVKYDHASATDSLSDNGTPSGTEESHPLRFPEAETQPGINSQLAASGT